MHGLRVGDNYGWMTKGTLGCHDCLLQGESPIYFSALRMVVMLKLTNSLYQLCLFLFHYLGNVIDVVNLDRASCSPLPTKQLRLSNVWTNHTPPSDNGLKDHAGRVRLWQTDQACGWARV